MKHILAVLAGLLLASPTYADQKIDPSPVVRVQCMGTVGSAVKIGEDKYMTAAHVVDGYLCHIGGELITNIVNERGDFATFRGPASPVKARHTCSGYEENVMYLASGYARGDVEITHEPWEASPFVIDGFRAFMGEAIPGMSGGAVFDQDGRVVGVVNMRWPARSWSIRQTSLCR